MKTYRFAPARDRPVLSLAPLCTRMVAAYRDRAGTVHLFTDAYDPRRETAFDDPLDSWEAEPRYLTTTDFNSWQDHGFALTRGRWRGGVARSDGDCVGAASPGVAVAGGKVLLFYAGKGPANPAGPFARTADREDLPGLIHLAVAPADENGAPAGPFEKRGPVTDYDAEWRSIRHDDPNAVVTGEEVLLFFKGIGPGQSHANRVFGVARTPVDRPEGPYRIHPEPILRTDRGVESPRVFRAGGEWQMFALQYSLPGDDRPRRYGHFRGDLLHWELVNDEVLATTSDRPQHGAADMCPLWTPFEPGPPKFAFSNRLDDGAWGDPGVFKQWLWEIEEVPGEECRRGQGASERGRLPGPQPG